MRRTIGATVALVGALALHGHAQPSQPIYLQYNGFVRNKDNHTLTLSFGYYNMNHVDVRIAVGEANGFLPGQGADPTASAETIPTLSAQVGAALNLNGDVQDDGLPRDGKLVVSWKKTGGPGSVMFSNTDTASTRAMFGSPGEYELELVANDGEKSSSVKVKVVARSATPTGG